MYRCTHTQTHTHTCVYVFNNLSLIAFKPILAPTHVYFGAVTSVYRVQSHRKDFPLLGLLSYHGAKNINREREKEEASNEEKSEGGHSYY